VLVRGKWIGSERRTVPIAPGIPEHVAREVLALDYGAPESLELLRAEAHNLAAVLVEPVQSRHLDLQPREFLHEVRKITREAGAMLVFDELITGFRCAPGGAQEWFGVKADLATYGKILGGGMPIGALAGRADCLDALDGGAWNFGDDSQPEAGMTFFAGTYVRHPLSMAAALAMLRHLKEQGPQLQQQLAARAGRAAAELKSFLAELGAPMQIESFSSMFFVKFAPDFAFGPLLFFHLREKGSTRGTTASSSSPRRIPTQTYSGSSRRSKRACASCRRAASSPAPHVRAALRQGSRRPTRSRSCCSPIAWARKPLLPSTTRSRFTCAGRWIEQLSTGLRSKWCKGTRRCGRSSPEMAACSACCPSWRSASRRWISQIWMAGAAERRAERIASASATPFDLAHGPLLRLQLLKLAEQEHDLIFTVHHIVCDGWSFGVVARDLARFYSAAAEAREPQSGSATAFREYCRWLTERQCRPEFGATEKYWLEQFSTPPPPLDLPVDHTRGSARSYRGARAAIELEPELLAELRRFSAQQRCTLFTTMLAAFQTLLHRLTGQDDVVVGIAASGQSAMGADELVGHCVNFLPIRARITPEADFLSFLGEQRRLVLDAFDHQDYTFGTLLQKLALPRDASRMPLLGATFNVDRSTTNLEFGGLTAEFELNPKERLGLELSLNVIETDQGTRLYCSYNRDLFDPETINRWLGHYRALLQAIITDSAQPLTKLPLLNAAEREQLLVQWNATAHPYPGEQPVHAIFSEWVQRTPEQVAITDGERRLSYGELNSLANRFAQDLRAAGVQPGDRVGLPAERTIAFVAAVLGTSKAGGVYVPLNLEEPAERRTLMERDCRVVLDLQKQPESSDTCDVAVQVSSRDAAYVLYTSGSTGVPKGVVVPHRAIARLVCGTDYVQIVADDVVALASNLCFDAVTFEIWGALLNGASLVITPTDLLISPPALEEHLTKHHVTTLFLTTSLFNQVAQQRPQLFSRLRSVVFGGEAAEARSVQRVLEHGRPQRLVNGYGPTETTTFAVAHVVEQVEGSRIPIGRPIANTTAFILDAQMQPVPIGVAGELFIGGPGVAIGYLNAPELSAAKFLETEYGRVYRTGDLARWLPDSTIEYLGRADQQIKLRGFRIEPGEIEAALGRIRGVGECAVVAREFGPNDRRLVAYYTQNGAPPPTPEMLARELTSLLPAYMVPAAFVQLPQLPLNRNGKVHVQALPLPTISTGSSSGYVAPESTVQAQLVEIWEELLDHQPIGVRDDFFELGGHSLLAARMLGLIEERLGARLSFATLFAGATIEKLADALLTNQKRSAGEQPINGLNVEGAKQPFFFFHGDFIGGGFYCQTLARHIGSDRPFYVVHPHGLRGELPPPTIEAMAAERLEEIRQVQPHGPYALGGFCNGALIAYEVARLLEEGGEKVNALLMLAADGSNVRHRPLKQAAELLGSVLGNDEATRQRRFRRWQERARLSGALGSYYTRAAADLLRHPTREQVARVWRKGSRILRRFRTSAPQEAAEAGNCAAPAAPPQLSEVGRAYADAIAIYIPGSYGGTATLLWPREEKTPLPSGAGAGWNEVCSEARVILVPGQHHTSVQQESCLRAIGGEMRRVLEEADAQRTNVQLST
jgi:amino acid adenylation domain-containing protein